MRERAVFFDIGNVLLKFDPRLVGKWFEAATGVKSQELYDVFWSGDLNPKIETGEMSCVALYDHLLETFGVRLELDRFQKMFNEIFIEDTRTVDILRRLKERHKVFLLSNTNPWHFSHIKERYAWAAEVDGAVLSFQVGARKPEPEIFKEALALARFPGKDCVFFDDLEENVEGSRKAGLPAHRFVSAERMQEDLYRLGFLA